MTDRGTDYFALNQQKAPLLGGARTFDPNIVAEMRRRDFNNTLNEKLLALVGKQQRKEWVQHYKHSHLLANASTDDFLQEMSSFIDMAALKKVVATTMMDQRQEMCAILCHLTNEELLLREAGYAYSLEVWSKGRSFFSEALQYELVSLSYSRKDNTVLFLMDMRESITGMETDQTSLIHAVSFIRGQREDEEDQFGLSCQVERRTFLDTSGLVATMRQFPKDPARKVHMMLSESNRLVLATQREIHAFDLTNLQVNDPNRPIPLSAESGVVSGSL